MLLGQIIRGTGASIMEGSGEAEITSICCDSRKVKEGSAFIAVKGCNGDGHDYIEQAVRNGAAAVIDADRKALALCADNFYGHPSGKLGLVGITGTNGKTTTATLLYDLFRRLGYKCGLISTISNYVETHRYETINTTPDPITINSLLSEMVASGCKYCFMEVSSVGAEQDRVAGLEFKAGIFSNLTHEHLEYHKTIDAYQQCKKKFFDSLGSGSVAVINIDDRYSDMMVRDTQAKVVTYSCKSAADFNCSILEQSFEGSRLLLDGKLVETSLPGEYNAYNILAMYCTAFVLGVAKEIILSRIPELEAPAGRFENFKGPNGLNVIIDYAHTPDALEKVLSTLRSLAPERELICLFGCTGDRDRTKRPEMAEISENIADKIFVTADDNRSEPIEDIMEDIRKGFSKSGLALRPCSGQAKVTFIHDRKEAIITSILSASANAIILLAGKGHENFLIDGKSRIPFSEKEIVKEAFTRIEE